jgi:hypothetical protein
MQEVVKILKIQYISRTSFSMQHNHKSHNEARVQQMLRS